MRLRSRRRPRRDERVCRRQRRCGRDVHDDFGGHRRLARRCGGRGWRRRCRWRGRVQRESGLRERRRRVRGVRRGRALCDRLPGVLRELRVCRVCRVLRGLRGRRRVHHRLCPIEGREARGSQGPLRTALRLRDLRTVLDPLSGELALSTLSGEATSSIGSAINERKERERESWRQRKRHLRG